MQKIVSFIPNLFTLGNLFCGCLAIIYAFNWQLDWSAYMVFLAAFLDFFDGFLARLLKVEGELGKQLDSLADMVSFGVVPGVIVYHVLIATTHLMYSEYLNYIALIIPMFSCYRLAKFNVDTRQISGFIGLPTPANAIFFSSMPLIIGISGFDWIAPTFRTELPLFYLVNAKLFAPILIFLIVLFSFLLVSNLPLFALKFKNFGWTDNKIRYIFLVLSVVLLILFQLIAIPFIVILYILTSIVNNIFKLTV